MLRIVVIGALRFLWRVSNTTSVSVEERLRPNGRGRCSTRNRLTKNGKTGNFWTRTAEAAA
jgi:hypothetical protein